MFHLNIVFVISQSALQNFGNIQIHNDGKLGFHINLINDGTFNMNEGLAGFYSSEGSLSISGTQILQFHNMEIDIANSLNLDINTIVTNTLSYLNGYLITPRDFPKISLDFSENSNYLFESDSRHTNGYVNKIGQNMFTFPIGDYGKIRPLSIPFQPISTNFNAAYFFEDPNFPSTFNTSFDTTQMDSYLNKVSIEEFWDFNGEITTSVKLTWNSLSDI
ncbi:hypothetical protein FHS04_000821 [Mesoflavibacter sabulilitoris]|uniref:Uncharacterized protein n=1 Tax=Mesoflavibacter zeaxanthinifaciens subsp. sabulilitoris TaxID=1520893 RepID=A0A2T1N639_9FLAO|nr:hypothetical protein [Mesoflavibacter zeaxanthinifaciens]MBB3123324.1 hypothetical protein [Mesoflavibacter zeaxanthinifaciens subsp. sabulilitoris]PSG87041.1 hypothetical protein C7H61_13095 [Mesoflavibacter zeaxanthinifaciens subsp. sabulilitoris]